MRPLTIPRDIFRRFEVIAGGTDNKETVACLLGPVKFEKGFYVTTLYVPKQDTSSGSCMATTTGARELDAFCETKNLAKLGWYHVSVTNVMVLTAPFLSCCGPFLLQSHPGLGASLSSNDMHMAAVLQSDIPEVGYYMHCNLNLCSRLACELYAGCFHRIRAYSFREEPHVFAARGQGGSYLKLPSGLWLRGTQHGRV